MNFQITKIDQINALLPNVMNEEQVEMFDDFGEIVIIGLIVLILVLVFKVIDNILNKIWPDKQRKQNYVLRTFK